MSLEILAKVQSEHASQKNVTFQIKAYQRFMHKDIFITGLFLIVKNWLPPREKMYVKTINEIKCRH